jgi:hypothetical protein
MEILFFVCGDAHTESDKSCMESQLGVSCFLYAVMRALKVIEVERYVD